MLQKITSYVTSVASEVSKISWPSKEELRESTIVVLVFSLLFGVAVYFMDTAFSYLLKLIF